MESRIFSEDEFKSLHATDLENCNIAFFKLVHIADSARSRVNNNASRVNDLVGQTYGHYLFSQNSQELRELLHIFVDNMIDAVEKQNE